MPNQTLRRYVDRVLRSLLTVVSLEERGRVASIDGFRLRNTICGSESVAPRFLIERESGCRPESGELQSIRSVALSEPRIELVARQLGAILRCVALLEKGKSIEANAFRLKNLNDWLIRASDNPDFIIRYLSWNCGAACRFCYQLGNPPNLKGERFRKSPMEIETRLEYYSPNKVALFDQTCFENDEILGYPGVIDILKKLRKKTKHPFLIITNGTRLTEEMIGRLSRLSPVRISLSLNSANPERRKEMMGDTHPEIAIRSLPILKSLKIPFSVSFVVWPGMGLGELKQSITYADKYGAKLITLFGGGFTKYFPRDREADIGNLWKAAILLIAKLRETTATPLVFLPWLYEEMLFNEDLTVVKVKGVFKGSPADVAGVKFDDEIVSVEGVPIATRMQAQGLLRLFERRGHRELALEISRNRQVRVIRLHYIADWERLGLLNDAWGILMTPGLGKIHVDYLKGAARKHAAQRVLVVTTKLMEREVQQLLTRFLDRNRHETEVYITVANNDYFGGNILVGGLMVVEDFIRCIRRWIRDSGIQPDLVLLPETPFTAGGGSWKRDLLGMPSMNIEREVGIPVELIPSGALI